MKENEIINELNKRVLMTIFDIDQYKIIFNDKPERMNLLKNTSSVFFQQYKEFFWRRMYTDIAKYSDYPGTGKNKVLTISVYEQYAMELNMEEYPKIVENNKIIRELAKQFKKIRNKVTVHIDYRYAIGKIKFDSDPNALLKVDEIFKLIAENGNYFIDVYQNVIPIDTGIIHTDGDARNLMKFLKKGYNAEQQNRS